MNSAASRMVVVTGLSGSGRSAALKAFEDIGFYCVDNLPIELFPAFVEFVQGQAEIFPSAIGIDIREKGFAERFPALAEEFKAHNHAIELLFLDASDQAIVRRFSETRRPHPLARGRTPLIDGIRLERTALTGVKKLADRLIDTSDFTVHELRQTIEHLYAINDGSRPMVITLVTFGYKYGVPFGLDLLLDLRFLPNPHFVPGLRPLTGEDPAVSAYILADPDSVEFLERLQEFIDYLLPRYRREGKSYLTIGFGCTGGRHRSVAVSREIGDRLRKGGFDVNIRHRDIGL